MLLSALVAAGHFLAFFALTAALVMQLVLITETPTLALAKRLQIADRSAGIAAVLLLGFGLLRVFYYAHGVDYYINNWFFLAKMALFACVALISIYPTLTFSRWNTAIKQNQAPVLSTPEVMKLRRVIHSELVMIAGIVVCASMMAHGLGYRG